MRQLGVCDIKYAMKGNYPRLAIDAKFMKKDDPKPTSSILAIFNSKGSKSRMMMSLIIKVKTENLTFHRVQLVGILTYIAMKHLLSCSLGNKV
jgi:hypothetical protein